MSRCDPDLINLARMGMCALALAVTTPAAGAQGVPATGFAGFGTDSDVPTEIESQTLEVFDREKKAVFTGDVVVVQGDKRMTANRLIVFYDGESLTDGERQISRLEASGAVVLTAPDQSAKGDAASFDMASQVMVMTGTEVVLTDGPNVVVGNSLTVDLETGKIDLDAPRSGRVRVLLNPRSVEDPGTGN